MDKRELHAIAKLMGYRVVAVNPRYNTDCWSTYVIHDAHGIMHIINTNSTNTTEETALAQGWDWLADNLIKDMEIRHGIPK